MDLQGLLSAIDAAARAEAEGLMRAASLRAEAIAAEGARKRELARGRARLEADAALDAALEAEVRSARHEAAAEGLQARQRFLDDVFARARALLHEAIASDDYRAGLARRLEEALGYVGAREAIVCCAPALEGPLRQLAGERARVEPDPAIGDGFEVTAGDLHVDARLSTELERRWPQLAVALARTA